MLFELRMLFMRWALVILTSFVIGALCILVSLIALLTALVLYTALGVPHGTQIGWDVVSLLGPHWQVILTTIPVAIFSLGFGLAFRLRQASRCEWSLDCNRGRGSLADQPIATSAVKPRQERTLASSA